MTGKVIPLFPEPKAACFDCKHAYVGSNGVLCEITRDFVIDEGIANDCEMFEEDFDDVS